MHRGIVHCLPAGRQEVGVVRLERTTSWSQTRNANQLRYTPILFVDLPAGRFVDLLI